jgi:hypothetical protein
MSVYLPTPQDFVDAPKGKYLGEYIFYRVDANGRRSDGSGKIVFGEMLENKYCGPDGGGTVEGEFPQLKRKDESAFFMDLFCIIQVFLRPHPSNQWKQIIRDLRFDWSAKEFFLGWKRVPPPSDRDAAKLQFAFRSGESEDILGFIRDPNDNFSGMFIELTVQLDMMFNSVPEKKARQIKKRMEFYRKSGSPDRSQDSALRQSRFVPLGPEVSLSHSQRMYDALINLPPERKTQVDNYDGLIAHLERILGIGKTGGDDR